MKKSYRKILAAAIFSAAVCLSACSGQTGDVSETMALETEETSDLTTASETTESLAETTAETTTEASSETTEETEPESETAFASDEAENFYNIIMSDLSWRKDEVVGATILDVHGDGVPEFLALYVDEENNRDMVDCYSFGDENLEFMYSFESFGSMTKYVDNGITKWWGGVYKFEQEDESNVEFSETGMRMLSYKSEATYGLFEFTENGPVMTDELFYDITEYDRETDIYKGEMYAHGELYGTDYIEEYSKLDSAPDLTYYSWFTSKAEWEGEHFTNDENYSLAPNTYYKYETDIQEDDCIVKLVNAYCLNDKEYLTHDGYFGEVNAFKPVIYLYPTETADISVRLRLDGQLTCTYPDYGTGWNVMAKPDGTLYDKRDGSEYSYLYWEGALNADWDMTKGFVVEGKDTAEFLREKLSCMGLTPREYNEFIVYWLPLMQNNKYNFITFQTEAYTNAAQLDISPEPDSMLRVFMVYRPLDDFIEIEEQQLPVFERKGFAVVEWGGSEY